MIAKIKTRLRPFIAASMVLALLSSSSTAAEKIKLDYIPAGAVGAVVMMPNKLSKLKELQLIPWEIAAAAGKQKLGFDPLDIDQAIAFMMSPSIDGTLEVGAVLHFSDGVELGGELLDLTEEAEVNGVAYRRGKRAGFPSLCVIDGNTVVIALEPVLKRLLTTRNEAGLLHRLLAKANTDHHVTAMVTFEPMREFLAQALPKLPPLPLPLNALRTIPQHLESLEINMNLSRLGSEYKLYAKSAESAQEVERIINDNLAFGKQAFLAQLVANMPDNGELFQDAMRVYFRRLTDMLEQVTRPSRDGNVLTIRTNEKKAGQIASVGAAGIAVGLLLPAVQAAREAARRLEGANDMKQIMLGMHNHHTVKGRLPAAANYDKDGKRLLSWRVHLLPFIEQGELYRQFHLDEPWDSEHNRKLISKMPTVYRNPNAAANVTTTNYLAVTGKGNAFDGKEGTQFRSFLDGLSNTIMFVEADLDRSVVWTKPADLEFDADDPLDGLGFLRHGVFQVALGDGSIQKFRMDIDLDILRAMMTRAGRERGNRRDF